MTTNEENGYYGAQFYSDTHDTDNIIRWIGTDQLGFNTGALQNVYKNALDKNIVSNITTLLDYEGKTGYDEVHNLTAEIDGYNHLTMYGNQGCGAEDVVFAERTSCDTILIHKNHDWLNHHHRGLNLTKGDVLNVSSNFDWNDAFIFYNITWATIKYFLYNPNCWIDNVTFTAFDSPNDGDTLNDSIRANFTIHSILPSDIVRIELNLSFEIEGIQFNITNAGHNDYTLMSRSQNESYVFTIPDEVNNGYFSASLNLYNSTGLLNRIVYGSPGYNDSSDFSEWHHLYHPLGYTKVGNSSESVNDRICGSVFRANEYGTADNITVYIDQNFVETTHYKCMLYRANDSVLIGTTTENWFSLGGKVTSPWWAVLNFTGTKPKLVKGTDYVITCWGDSAFSYVYYNESEFNTMGRYDIEEYGAPPDPASFTNESRYYSIYCSYSPDTAPPEIFNVNATPHTVGFGYDVTIVADVIDNLSSIDTVMVQIGYPGGKSGNFTMTHVLNGTYQFVFNDTWLVGRYNYSIWAVDNSSNSNSSSGYHFHVSANATISIATLQDSYNGNEYINITDPPNPPENYTLVGRGLTWDEYYYHITGQNILEISTGPVNYQDDNDTWTPINTTLNQLDPNHPGYVYGYRTGNDHGLYGAYFKSNAQSEWPIAFTYNNSDDLTIHSIRSKLIGVGYVDPQSDWAYKYLQNAQSSPGQLNGDSITYAGIFTGTDVTWSYRNIELKEEITLSNTTKTILQNHPPSQYGLNNASSYLVFITKLDHQNLNIYNASGLLDGNVTISDTGVEFRDLLGQFKCAMPLGEAYELNNESMRQKLTYRVIHFNGDTYLLSGLKVSDLNEMTFPVIIDPTLSVNSLYTDGFIYNSSSRNYTTVWEAPSGTIDSSSEYLTIGQKKAGFPISSYYVYRSYVLFNTTSLPANAYLDNAILSLYKRDDYSTTDFDLTIQNGQPTYPQNPLREGDYDKEHYSGDGGSYNTAYFVNGRNNISITELGWINDEGITKLCLRSSRDINGNAPTGNEYINVYSTNAPLGAYVPKLIITYRNQSKIKNIGETDINGYLRIQVQYYNTSQSTWVLDNDTINETTSRTITNGNQLALDTIFNGQIRASELTHGTGTYRVYTAFRDPEGNILRTNDDVDLEAWWQFNKT